MVWAPRRIISTVTHFPISISRRMERRKDGNTSWLWLALNKPTSDAVIGLAELESELTSCFVDSSRCSEDNSSLITPFLLARGDSPTSLSDGCLLSGSLWNHRLFPSSYPSLPSFFHCSWSLLFKPLYWCKCYENHKPFSVFLCFSLPVICFHSCFSLLLVLCLFVSFLLLSFSQFLIQFNQLSWTWQTVCVLLPDPATTKQQTR